MNAYDRLKKIREDRKLTQLQFGELIGWKHNKVRDIESGKQKITLDVAHEIESIFGIKKEWLLNGVGSAYAGSEIEKVQFDDSVSPLDDFILVPRYAVSGSAGAGALVDSEEVIEYLSFRKEWVQNSLRVKEGSLAVIGVIGDSMEPRLRDGDVVLLDMSHRAIEDNAIYALQFNGGLSIKRVQRFMSGSVEIISDNPRYKTETLSPDQAENVKVIGRVVWAGGKV